MSTTSAPSRSEPPKRGPFRAFFAYIFLPHAKPGEIVIISHSNMFYWWPVWLVGFTMGFLTLWGGHQMVVVPRGTEIVQDAEGQIKGKLPDTEDKSKSTVWNLEKGEKREVLIVPEKKHLPTRKMAKAEELIKPVSMAPSKNYGVFFVVVLLLVVFITNVPLRGLWSLFVIVVILMLVIILAQSGMLERLLNRTRVLAIHINAGGYMVISTVVLILWLVNFFFFDRQFYLIFAPGQVRTHLEIGSGETSYDTTGMVFHKQRSDLFRHIILGFGSGDLIVTPGGGKASLDVHNVLGVGRKVRQIEKRLAEKEVVSMR